MSRPALPDPSIPAKATPSARPAWPAILLLAAAVVAVHVVAAVISPYGFHRDEFLYMAMGRHLRLFSMDFPPLIAILAEAQRALFGDSLGSLRLTSALAHGALVLLTPCPSAPEPASRTTRLRL